jgi:endoglucanase
LTRWWRANAAGRGARCELAAFAAGTAAVLALAFASPALALPPGLHVSGNRLLDARGRRVALHGVNRSGTEYACVQGWGMFDGPSDASSARAIASWQVNFVRVPINEDCWLSINDVKPALSGAAYRRAMVDYVRLLNRNGIYVEVSLIWAAPGRQQATIQPVAPDEDHAPAVWRSMARTFAHDHEVILAPWGETEVSARCFLRGGRCGPYRVAGMQQAVRVMRAAGYRGVISIPGIDYANDLSHWLAQEPHDPLHQLVAEAHVYGGNTCDSVACLDRTMAPVARRVPLIFGEYGPSYNDSTCGPDGVPAILRWADAHHAGYAAWTWDTWGNCEALIKSYDGTPANAWGAFVRSRYAAVASGGR